MSIASFIVERFAEVSTILLSMFFLYRTLDVKISTRKQIVAGVIFLCIRMTYYIIGFGFNPYFSLAAGVIYSYFVFAGKLRTQITWNVIAIVIDGVVDASVISVYLLFPGASSTNIDLPGVERIIITIVAKILLFVVYYIVTMKVDKNDSVQWKDSIYLYIVPIGCWIMLELLFAIETEFAE